MGAAYCLISLITACFRAVSPETATKAQPFKAAGSLAAVSRSGPPPWAALRQDLGDRIAPILGNGVPAALQTLF